MALTHYFRKDTQNYKGVENVCDKSIKMRN